MFVLPYTISLYLWVIVHENVKALAGESTEPKVFPAEFMESERKG